MLSPLQLNNTVNWYLIFNKTPTLADQQPSWYRYMCEPYYILMFGLKGLYQIADLTYQLGPPHRKERGFTAPRPWSSAALMPFPRTMSRKGLKPHWWHLISLEFLVRFDLGKILATRQVTVGVRVWVCVCARGGVPMCLWLQLGDF